MPLVAHARAEAVLRDRLTPAQRADVDKTGWFNVRDASGALWRVCAGIDEGARLFPNLVDGLGNGRTMQEAVGSMPDPDLALALLLWLNNKELARDVHRMACRDPARTAAPFDPGLVHFYAGFGEDVGGGPPSPSTADAQA